MPFSCHVEGGRVILVPASTQSYRIYGSADHRPFIACSQFRPNLCHSWTVHQFDLDCGGTRTSWLSVAAAMAPWSGNRNWVSGGRFHLLAGSGPGTRPGIPCGGMPYPFNAPWPYGPQARPWPCVEGAPEGPRVIDLPPGFAPVPRGLAEFVAVPAAPAVAANVTAPSRSSGAAPAGSDKDVKAPGSPDAAPSREPDRPAKLPQANSTAVAKADRSALASTAKLGGVTNADTNITGSLAKSPKTSSAAAATIVMAEIVFALAALLSVGLTMLVLSRRRGHAALSVQFEQQAPAERPQAALEDRPVAREVRSVDQDWLPTTPNEALHVLGAIPGTGLDVLKNMVKRLRQTWHPDHAKDEHDRSVRERRLKQINVAWDILCGKRPPRRGASAYQGS